MLEMHDSQCGFLRKFLLSFKTKFIIYHTVRKNPPLLAYETDDCFSDFSLYGESLFIFHLLLTFFLR
jgi:hypothetical protein